MYKSLLLPLECTFSPQPSPFTCCSFFSPVGLDGLEEKKKESEIVGKDFKKMNKGDGKKKDCSNF